MGKSQKYELQKRNKQYENTYMNFFKNTQSDANQYYLWIHTVKM